MSTAGAGAALNTFAERAAFMATRGARVIPVPPRSKKANLTGWEKLATNDLAQIAQWGREFPDHNTGVVAKPDSLWLLDADDGRIVGQYEQETGHKFPDTFTVQSQPGRGHFYFLPTDASRGLGNVSQDKVKNRAFSVRAENEYVVGPGSIHPVTGEPYKIIKDAPFVPVPDSLVAWIKTRVEKKPVRVKKERREKVAQGGRNAYLASYAGSLQRVGISLEGLCQELLRENAETCVPALPDDEVLAIARSISRYEPEAQAPAAPISTPSAPAPASTEEEDEEEPEIVDEPLPEFPVVPGMIGELADALCPDVPREFKIMALVTRAGLMLSGRVKLEGETHLQPRFYTCMIAPPHAGKTAANNEVERLFLPQHDYLSVTSVDSGPALVDTFQEISEKYALYDASGNRGARLLLNPDELRDLFEKAKASKESRNSIGSELLKLFEANVTGNRSRQNGVKEISNAHLAIIGGAPPQVYEEMWLSTGGAASGLQSRFTLVTSNKKMPEVQGKWSAEEVAEINGQLRKQIENPPQEIHTSPEALALFREWWRSTPRDRQSEARVADLVKRFLMVLTVTNGLDKIEPWLMKVGIAFGDYQIALREKFNPDDASGWVQGFEQRILRAFRKHGELTERQIRRLISPEKHKGGFGPFLQALKNLQHASVIVKTGSNQKAAKFGLSDGRTATGAKYHDYGSTQ